MIEKNGGLEWQRRRLAKLRRAVREYAAAGQEDDANLWRFIAGEVAAEIKRTRKGVTQ
jgi:ribosomal protein L18E